MCGLCGIAGLTKWEHRKVIQDLLLMNQLRGEDGAGLGVYTKKLKTVIKKKAMTASDFLGLKEVDKFIYKYVDESLVTMGHTRAATTREISDDVTHPFEYGHIMLAHNGVIRAKGGLKTFGEEGRIDSQDIAHHMESVGEKETLEALHGDFALTWVNTSELTLNFARNEHRPLYFCYANDGKVMFWASEAWMLRGALARADMDIVKDEVYSLNPLTWLKFNLTENDFRVNYEVIKFKSFTFPLTNYNTSNANGAKKHAPTTPNQACPISNVGWKDGKLDKPHIKMPSAGRQSELLKTMGIDLDVNECMQFMNETRLAGDTTRCNITGNIMVSMDGADMRTQRVNAVIYASNLNVWDSVGQGSFAEVRVRGIQKDMQKEQWMLVCDFVKPWKKDNDEEAEVVVSTQRDSDGPSYDEHEYDMSLPFMLPDPEKEHKVPSGMKLYADGTYISDIRWAEKTKAGCLFCTVTPLTSEHAKIVWLNTEEFVCWTCATQHNESLALPIANKVKMELTA